MKLQLIVVSLGFLLIFNRTNGRPNGVNYFDHGGAQRRFLGTLLNYWEPALNQNFGIGSSFGFNQGQGQMPTQRLSGEKEKEKKKEKTKTKKLKVKPVDFGYITSLGPFVKTSFPKPNPGYYGGGYYVWNW